MNESTFQSQRTHTRVKFAPLTVSCTLRCITPDSPAAQSVNTLLSPVEHEPDRSVSPTVIQPDVRAVDPDAVFTHGAANASLSLDSMAWTVNGQPIADVWTESADYEIVTTADDTRGCLRIKKNLNAGEVATLHFTGQFLDWRTGVVYQAESDDLPLSCTDKGADRVQLSVDKPLIEYDPLYDDLLLYDYKAANGLAVSGTRASHKDGKSFEQDVTLVLTDGLDALSAIPSGMTLRLVELGTDTAVTANSEAHPEVTAVGFPMGFPTISFDMRMIDKAEFEARIVKDGKVVANATIGLSSKATMPSFGKPLRGSDIAATQTEYFNSALLQLADKAVGCPELYYMIQWHTQAKHNDSGTWKYAAAKDWQRGENMEAAVAGLGIGLTSNDSFFDLWFDVDAHAACQLVADESGEVLLDEDGAMLID